MSSEEKAKQNLVLAKKKRVKGRIPIVFPKTEKVTKNNLSNGPVVPC